MAGQKKLKSEDGGPELVGLLNKRNFPHVECPLCGEPMPLLIKGESDRESLFIAYSCGCDEWELLEEEIALAEIEVRNKK